MDISYLESLPAENLLRILLKTPFEDVVKTCKLSKHLNTFCKENNVFELYSNQGFIQIGPSVGSGKFTKLNFPYGYIKKFKVISYGIIILSGDDKLYIQKKRDNSEFLFLYNDVTDFDANEGRICVLQSGKRIRMFYVVTERWSEKDDLISDVFTPCTQIVCGNNFQACLTTQGYVIAKGYLFSSPQRQGLRIFDSYNSYTSVFGVYPCHKLYASDYLLCIITKRKRTFLYGYIHMAGTTASFEFEDSVFDSPFSIGGVEILSKNISISNGCIILYRESNDKNITIIMGRKYIIPNGVMIENENISVTPLVNKNSKYQHIELSENWNFTVTTDGLMYLYKKGYAFRRIAFSNTATRVTNCQIHEDHTYILCNIYMPYIASCIMCSANANYECGNKCGTFYCNEKCAQTHWNNGHLNC